MCMYKLEMVAHIIMPALERWKQEDQKFKVIFRKFKPSLVYTRDPFWERMHGTEHMGCTPGETEARKITWTQELKDSLSRTRFHLMRKKKKVVHPYKYTCQKGAKKKEMDLSGQDFYWGDIFPDPECSDINLSFKRSFRINFSIILAWIIYLMNLPPKPPSIFWSGRDTANKWNVLKENRLISIMSKIKPIWELN